ncbi:MAG: hypothetical protein AAFS10_24600, partial [Myxococcota bacterium]
MWYTAKSMGVVWGLLWVGGVLMASCSETYAPGHAHVSQEPATPYQSDGEGGTTEERDAGGGVRRDVPEPLDTTDSTTEPLDVALDSTEPDDTTVDSTESIDTELSNADTVLSDITDGMVDTDHIDALEHHVALAIVTPEEDMVIGAYDPIQFAGQVLESSLSVEELRLEWSSDRDGVLYSDAARSNGMVRPDEVQLTTPGEHTVFLRAYRGALLVGETSVVVQVCGWEVDARFVGRQDVEPGRWELWANASLTSEDAVDLTGLGRMRRGGLVYTERPIEVHYT